MGETLQSAPEKNNQPNETLSKIEKATQAFKEYSAAKTLYKSERGEKPEQTEETELGGKIDEKRSAIIIKTDSYWTDGTNGKDKQGKLEELRDLKDELIASAKEKSDDPETVAGAMTFVDKNIGNSRSWEMTNDVLKAFPDILPALARKILGSFSKEIDDHGPLSITDPNAREILKTMVSKVDKLPPDQIEEKDKEELTLWNNQLEGNDFHEASLEARKEMQDRVQEGLIGRDAAEAELNNKFLELLPNNIDDQMGPIAWHGIRELSSSTNAESSIDILSQIAKKMIEQYPENEKLHSRLQGFVTGAVEGFLLSRSELGSENIDNERRKEMEIKAAEMLQNALEDEVSIHDLTSGESPLGKEVERIVTEVGGQNTLNEANELSKGIHVARST